MDRRTQFGNAAETFVAKELRSQGYSILQTQYRTKLGEIDLICQDGDEVVFVEVKARNSLQFGYPEDSVTKKKIGHILRVGEQYLRTEQKTDTPWRIDVVSVEFQYQPPKLTHIKSIDIPEEFW